MPVPDRLRIHSSKLRGSAGEGAEPCVVASPDEIEHPRRDRIAARRHGHPPSVAASVGASRDGVGQAGSEALLLLTTHRVQRCKGPHEVEHRLQQVGVDHLAPTRMERHHRGERRGETGHLVGEGDRWQEWCAVGLAVERGEP